MRRYGETKLMNILWTRELARRLEGTGVTANAVHPGGVRSNLGNPARWQRALVSPFMISAERGAATSIFVATDPGVAGITGGYWAKCRPADDKLTTAARDDALAGRLWDACASLTAS
jgi:retinol dehydrogenase-12